MANDYIPFHLVDCYKPISLKEGHIVVSAGQIICTCGYDGFMLTYSGDLNNRFGHCCLQPNSRGDLFIDIQCKKCGKFINLFNNHRDGYDSLVSGAAVSDSISSEMEQLICTKCGDNANLVKIKYEHLRKTEYNDDGIPDYRNAFQWI